VAIARNGKCEWIIAWKKVYEKATVMSFAGYLQDKYPHLYEQGVWIFGDWERLYRSGI